jgi:hypothetical protein
VAPLERCRPRESREQLVTSDETDDSGFVLLLVECQAAIASLAEDGRTTTQVRVREIATQLDSYGIDGRALVRYGFADRFAGAIAAAIAVSVLKEFAPRSSLELPDWGVDAAAWREAVGLDVAADLDSALTAVVKSLPPMLLQWVANAPFDDLLALKASAPAEMAALIAPDPSKSPLFERYGWIVDRTVTPQPERWGRASLLLEYRTATLDEPSFVPPTVIDARAHDLDDVAHAIALRVCQEADTAESEQWAALMTGMQQRAAAHLEDGQYAQAASLFDFMVSRRPGDATALNNLGFCLMPVDRAKAAHYLREGVRNGFEPMCVALHNLLMCAETDADRSRVLLEAEHYWASDLDVQPQPCTLWAYRDGTWTAYRAIDARRDVATLAAHVAQQLGRYERVPVWQERAETLGGGPPLIGK